MVDRWEEFILEYTRRVDIIRGDRPIHEVFVELLGTELVSQHSSEQPRTFLQEELSKERLLIITHDDHTFVLIGSGHRVHLIEDRPEVPNFFQTIPRSVAVELFTQIATGTLPDRKYRSRYSRKLNLQSWNRKRLSSHDLNRS